MNHTYRLVWSQLARAWIAVAENAKGKGKSIGAGKLLAAALAVAAAFPVSSTYAANAADATVTLGSGSVSTVGKTTTIKQNSQNLAIDWVGLSTAANEALIFNQPNSSAIALNRITGSSPSTLLGSLTANGQVFILNPNGVLFGAGSQVNVGGLVASTLGMSNADLQAGRMVFALDGNTNGSVVNQGKINAADGGYVALIAGTVRNEGEINAKLGTALLAAGNKVTLNINNGSLLAYSIDQGALNALAENKQLIQANGGQVLMSAKALNTLTTAVVNNTGLIEAKTIENRNGRIMLMGDMEVGTVNVAGTLDASAPTSGDGGFVETSAASVNVASGTRVITRAASGLGGNWLIDPTDFTITAGSGTNNGSSIGADTLSSNLADGNITIATSAAGTGNGDIFVNSAVSWAADSVLTLTAHRNINFNTALTASGTNAGLELNYGGDYIVKAPITLSGSNSTLKINGNSYTLIRSMAQLDALDGTNATSNSGIRVSTDGYYALAQDLNAAGITYVTHLLGTSPLTFGGTFAGLGHTISNLTINSSSTSGLFGAIGAAGVVRDMGIVGGNISGGATAGAIASSNNGTISNVYSTANISGTQNVGGLVGLNNSTGTLFNSYASGNVSGTTNVGGLLGQNVSGTISKSYATGNVSGGDSTGGLIGFQYSSDLTNVYATGNVTSSGKYVGGLIGQLLLSNISNTYATGDVTGSGYTGGLVGWQRSSNISNSYVTGTLYAVAPGEYMGALVGMRSTGDIRASFWRDRGLGGVGFNMGTGSVSNSRGLTAAEFGNAATFTAAGWNASNIGGDGTVWRIYDGKDGPLLRSYLTTLTLADTVVDYNGTTRTGASTALAGVLGSVALARDAGSVATNYYSAQQGYDIVGGGLTINKANLTVSSANIDKTYDGTLSASGNLVVVAGTVYTGDQLGGGIFSFEDKNVGSGKTVKTSGAVVGNGISNANYNITYADNTNSIIRQANLTVTAGSVTKTYDGTLSAAANAVVGALAGAAAGETIGTAASQVFTDKNAGAGNKTVQASGLTIKDSGNVDVTGNYNITYVDNTTSTINKADLTVTANGVSKTYDGTTAAIGTATVGILAGVAAGDVVNAAATLSFTDKNVGAGNKTVRASGLTLKDGNNADVSGNYNISYVDNTSSTINQAALSISGITAADKVYNASDVAGINTTGAQYHGLFAGDVVNVMATGLFNDKNVGNGKTVTLSSTYNGADTGNYIITDQATTTASISQAALSISGITAADKTYNASDAANVSSAGAQYHGLYAGDVVNVAATGSFSDKNVGTGKTVNLSSTYSGADSANYIITDQATTTASISQATLSISGITASDKTYNASDAAGISTTGAQYHGLYAGDVVSVTATGLFSDKNAGENKTVNLSSNYSGADVANYLITDQATTVASIQRASLTVSSSDVVKTYDGNTSAAGSAVVAAGTLFAGDSLSGGSYAFDNKNAGNGNKIVHVSGVSVGDGINSDNYDLSYVSNSSSTINKADLTVQANGISKVYDGGLTAQVTYLDTAFAGDQLIYTGNASFNDKNVGGGKTINVSGIMVGGIDAGNYNLLSNTAATSADITPAALTVTANSDSKFYDGIAYSQNKGSTITGFVGGESIADLNGVLTYGGNAQGAKDIGHYTITNAGLSGSNYVLTFVDGVVRILPVGQASAAVGGPALAPAYEAVLSGNSRLDASQPQTPAAEILALNVPKSTSRNADQPPTPRLTVSACGMNLPPAANQGGC
ncbi:large exoproteins involved in heme utilization or adhesion [Janthinobacterium sp. Marseille]|nr:YDG domain-containing protein [Janthinobacterium sp. Marseille]ABR91077.1 large exoproteins involved in heme utilization or adhesion [Janthinobacterium sp. Marseille]